MWCLYPSYANGDLGARLEEVNEDEERIRLPLQLKKKWCLQIVEPMHHTHRVTHTYHMDIKPSHFLLTDSDGLVLIDWEHYDAPAKTLAPEADGTWDVEEAPPTNGGNGKLVYTRYAGPERRNVDENAPGSQTWNEWNLFPIWSEEHPKALELAEVFSVGRTMWIFLRQPDSEKWDEVEHPNDLVVDWDGADDVPMTWKKTVKQCLAQDPNERPNLVRLGEIILGWEEEGPWRDLHWKGQCR